MNGLYENVLQAVIASAKFIVEPFWFGLALYGIPLTVLALLLARVKRYRKWLRMKKGYIHILDKLPGVHMRSFRNLQIATIAYLGTVSACCLYLFIREFGLNITNWQLLKGLIGIILLYGTFIEEWQIRLRFNKIDTVQELLDLTDKEFEHFVANYFRKCGYRAKVTGSTGDFGVDIVVSKWFSRGIVQCKRYKGTVPSSDVRDLAGCLLRTKADEAFLITTGTFSADGIEFAEGLNIRLIDGKTFSKKL